MSSNWDRVNELFYAAVELQEDRRADFLKETCGKDDALRKEVEALLAAHEQAGAFIQTPALKNALEWLTDSDEQLSAGKRIGAYKIIREIGRGGMGAVYLAERADEQYEKYVAIKLIKRGMDTESVLRRFRNERQILADFDHPNIARLLDGGTESGLPYFVMEYVEGQPIDDYCDTRSLSITQRLELFRQVCAAVSYAHRHLVIHRDLKPSNIVVTPDGIPKLLDFGIAKIMDPAASGEAGATATGIRPMTPEYASPEQARGVPVTTGTDVYSMGVVLYELLTGHFPYRFQTLSPIEIARVITETNPPSPSAIINTVEGPEASPPSLTPESVSKCREGTAERLRRRLQGDLDNIVLKAIRKEPERRYQSVEQFSEDIRRHLEGLPVSAQKDTFFYRSAKFVRRNKVAVLIAALAFLAIAFSAIVAVVIQWRANQQARFLQEFGQEAARMEGIMRFAYLLPLHDITQERKMVEIRIKGIETRMAQLGGAASGPGHYAMARGFMALQRYDEAKKHFELAMNQYGYKTSEVSYAYGLTLAMLYQIQLDSAARISNKELRALQIKKIQNELKFPALSYVQAGRQAAEYSGYTQALIDLLDERFDKAIQGSEKAVQDVPWLYESFTLEGESYRRMAQQFRDQGKYPEALQQFAKAETAYKKSVQKGTSDPRGYAALCRIEADLLLLYAQQEGPAEAAYHAGVDECRQALRADANDVESLLALTTLHTQWVLYLYPREGSQKAAEEAIRAGQVVSRLRPDDPRAHRALGAAYFVMAEYCHMIQTDPSKAVEAGNRSFEKAIRIDPNDSNSYYYRGLMFQSLAQYQVDVGKDPRKALDLAVRFMNEASKMNTKSVRILKAVGDILTTEVEYETENGLDASAAANASILALQKGLNLNPNDRFTFGALGFACLSKAEYLVAVGRSPVETLKQAQDVFTKAIQIRSDYAPNHGGLGQADWRLAESLVDSKQDPTAYIMMAKEALEQSRTYDKTFWPAYAISGELELVTARWEILNGRSPERRLQNALVWLQRAQEVSQNPEFYEIWYSRVRVYRCWAEWKLQSKQSAEKEIRIGTEMAERAQKINPHSGEMMALRGVFSFLQARSVSNESERKELLQKAHSLLQDALKINANVSHAFAPYLKEVEAQQIDAGVPSASEN
jgi:serine/threonine protein kinase/tetratricopeptide (TPR) repeat protein